MPSVLLINYLFPPFGGVGVQRVLSLAKYLPSQGFDVHVLTPRNPASVGKDLKLLAQVPPEVKVHRTVTLDVPWGLKKALKKIVVNKSATPSNSTGSTGKPSRLVQFVNDLLLPDPQVLWVPIAIPAAKHIVREHNIDAVIATVPSFSTLLIGNAVKKAFPRAAFISDFRDEWITYYIDTLAANRSPRARACAIAVERTTAELSDFVVAVTEAARREIRSRYPEMPESKFRLVTNGYDPDAFRDFSPRPNTTGKTLLTYTGTLYKPADPTPLFEALDTLPAPLRSSLLLRFIGHVEGAPYRAMLEAHRDISEHKGFLPQRDALKVVEETDYLLLIWHDTLNVPGKFYDYLGTGKPILALADPRGDLWKMMERTNAGWCADVRDKNAICTLLESAHQRKEFLSASYRPNREVIAQYARPELVAQYGRVLREAIASVTEASGSATLKAGVGIELVH